MNHPVLAWSLICLAAALALVNAQAPTVWDGVYTAAQAARGQAVYEENCSVCHGTGLHGTDEGPALAGHIFEQHWFEDNVKNLFAKIQTRMPADAPGSLAAAAYLDIVTYLLQANGFPAGGRELPLDDESLGRIQIVGKGGPGPVPDSALVRVFGCLTREGDKAWIVSHATAPVRTRDPESSRPAAAAASTAPRQGTQTFRLLEVMQLDPASHVGQRVEVKGFLIRRPGDDRLNVTSLQILGSRCE